nr:hypothetical protein GCM10020185_00130 [Pseudomonas brassicacearum subsp. brassicacearum]
MQSGDDGTLYVAGADIYKVNVQTGKFDVLIPSRNWKKSQLQRSGRTLRLAPSNVSSRLFCAIHSGEVQG